MDQPDKLEQSQSVNRLLSLLERHGHGEAAEAFAIALAVMLNHVPSAAATLMDAYHRVIEGYPAYHLGPSYRERTELTMRAWIYRTSLNALHRYCEDDLMLQQALRDARKNSGVN